LLERGELELLPVRKKISEDIATVNQYAAIDVSAVSQEIDDLLTNLKPVNIENTTVSRNVELIPSETVTAEKESEQTDKKDSLVNRVKKTINDAVIIRKLEKPLQEDLDTDAKERLYQLFSLRFETLKIMLLQEDGENYKKQLARIISLVTNYYSEDDRAPYLEKLNELVKVDLSPEVPKANSSLKLLEKIMMEKNILDKNQNNKIGQK